MITAILEWVGQGMVWSLLRVSHGVEKLEGRTRCWVRPSVWLSRRRPTLPHSLGCSTIGAGGLSFRVRNGSGRFPTAMAAVTLFNCHTLVLGGVCLLVVSCTVDAVGFVAWWCCGQVLGLLVPVG